MRLLRLSITVILLLSLSVSAQQPTPAPIVEDMSAPYQINWLIPVDAGTVNMMISIINAQIRIGRKNFIILISSQGGEVLSGLTAYNFLHGLKVDITTFNMGQVDSAANLIFCAGNHRYALPDSRFLLHSSFTLVPPGTPLSAQFLDGQFQQVQSMNRLMADVLNATTKNKHTEEVDAALRGQRILTPADAKAWGLIDEERSNYLTPNAVIATIESSHDTSGAPIASATH